MTYLIYKSTIFFFISSFFCFLLRAEDIKISGPTTVCPGVEYTYTASASNIFGDTRGCFSWYFLENGQWQLAPGTECACGTGNSSRSSITKKFNDTGTFQVKVNFAPLFDPFNICPVSSKTFSVNARVFSPGVPRTSNGSLTFCGPGQTQTVSIPGIPTFDPETCNWHHKYDWIVPTGWKIVTTGSIGYSIIPGGIRTASKTVEITAPNSTLVGGYGGNYYITVKTEAAWPWPEQSSRQIWVGVPPRPNNISGPSIALPNQVYSFSVSEVAGASSYKWFIPNEFRLAGWSCVSTCSTSRYASMRAGAKSSYVSVYAVNACGNSLPGNKEVFVQQENCPPGGCEEPFRIYPNPSVGHVNFELSDSIYHEKLKDGYQIKIYNQFQDLVFEKSLSKKHMELNTSNFPTGLYIINIIYQDGIIQKQLIIE